jgi:large subunit ribosomal protein L29
MTKAAELLKMNDEELAHHLEETRQEVFHLRFQLAMGKQDNSARLGSMRREVARTLTLQRQRQLGHAPATPAPGRTKTKGAR